MRPRKKRLTPVARARARLAGFHERQEQRQAKRDAGKAYHVDFSAQARAAQKLACRHQPSPLGPRSVAPEQISPLELHWNATAGKRI